MALAEALGGEIKGKTRIQKLTYFVEKDAWKKGAPGFTYNHELYHYGPFSVDLCLIMDDLVDDELLERKMMLYESGKILYIYKLTHLGKIMLKEFRGSGALPKDLDSMVKRTARRFGSINLYTLIQQNALAPRKRRF